MKAVVLLSGGLDSATTLACAQRDGRRVTALTVNYGQTHDVEVRSAELVAHAHGVAHHIVSVPVLGELAPSALTGVGLPKKGFDPSRPGVPSTYVPARNTVLLGFALALAESIGARAIYTGFNVLDASGYPDCRPAFVAAFQVLANVATAPGEPWRIEAPLIDMTKAKIIRLGISLEVDYSITWSCYSPDAGRPCRRCDACQLRARGFAEVGIPDPALA